MSLDALPKQINAAYNNKNYPEAEKSWKSLSEKDKACNRQAADHLWSKIRLVWPKINWRYDPVTFEPDPEVAHELLKENFLVEYGEIEHRRRCADLLLQGFVPFDYKHDSPEYKEFADNWDTEEGFKEGYQIQKIHISLVPYQYLTAKNRDKDIAQIKEISEFLRRVVDTSH